jgi:hypothetical protein
MSFARIKVRVAVQSKIFSTHVDFAEGKFHDNGIVDNKKTSEKSEASLWEHTGSNRGPSACKADALNQLSYAPFVFGSAKISGDFY